VQGAFNISLILSQEAHKPSHLCIQFQPCKLLLIPGDRVLAHYFVLLLIVVDAFEVQKNTNNNRSGGLDSNGHWIEWKHILHTALGMHQFLLHSILSRNCYTMNENGIPFAIN
jgi:hypothetical protein